MKMLIKKLLVQNIRTYKNQTVLFPKGSVLLSGDIGSGKTSLLLAIEFALFGFVKGSITGDMLLRHDASTGLVQLEFEIDNKNVLIQRVLKRSKTGVKQENGFIVINNKKYDLSPTELKAKVLELLGYPQALLQKNRELLYRYTVFTPQEQMKQIILEKPDDRLKILRKLFGIDKYQRIKDNASAMLRFLKSKKVFFKSQVEDMPSLEQELQELQSSLKDLQSQFFKADQEFQQVDKDLKLLTESLEALESKLSQYNDLLLRIGNLTSKLNEKKNQLVEKQNALADIKLELSKLPERSVLQSIVQIDVSKQISSLEKDLQIAEQEISEKLKELANIESQIAQSQEIISQVSSLDYCPLCKQKVGEQHKAQIKKKEQDKIGALQKQLDLTSQSLAQTKDLKKSIQDKIESLKQELSKKLVAEKDLSRLESLTSKKNVLEQQIQELERVIPALQSELNTLNQKLESFKSKQEQVSHLKAKHKALLEKHRTIFENKTRLEKELEFLNMKIQTLKEALSKKSVYKQKLERLESFMSWLESFYLPLIDLIEEKVMAKLQLEFNNLFSQWFSKLVDDLEASIDAKFTPVIKQQGFETDFQSLSGGERTAVALAYRLALNTVVNKLASGIKTKDILILDEPTEGFSSEQLDKVRDVFQDLNLKQIIIVSHESKVETFVDHVLRVEKQEGVSKVIQ